MWSKGCALEGKVVKALRFRGEPLTLQELALQSNLRLKTVRVTVKKLVAKRVVAVDGDCDKTLKARLTRDAAQTKNRS